MIVIGRVLKVCRRLTLHFRREWTKNDGKPVDEWEPGRDLKETVLVVLMAACTIAMIGGTIMLWLG